MQKYLFNKLRISEYTKHSCQFLFAMTIERKVSGLYLQQTPQRSVCLHLFGWNVGLEPQSYTGSAFGTLLTLNDCRLIFRYNLVSILRFMS